jgi:hypothetical protein
VYSVLHELVSSSQKLGGDQDNRGSAVTDLLVLLVRKVDEDLAGGVLDVEKAENRGTIVGDSNILVQCEKDARGRQGIGVAYANIVHHHLVEAAGAEGTLDNICDRLGSKNCAVSVCVVLILPISNIGLDASPTSPLTPSRKAGQDTYRFGL